MSLHDVYDGTLAIAATMESLGHFRVTMTVGDDMGEYEEIIEKWRPNQKIGAPFDRRLHDLDKSNCFWMVGRDPDGRVIHTQAMRLIHLGRESLGDYMRESFREFPPVLPDLDLPRSRYRAGPGAKTMRGDVCYHGEFWIDPEGGQYRGSGLSTVLGRFAFLTATARWAPDYIFGFMAQSVAFKGFAARHGYMHAEPGALRWYRENNDTPLEGLMVYMGREDIRYLMSLPVQDMAA